MILTIADPYVGRVYNAIMALCQCKSVNIVCGHDKIVIDFKQPIELPYIIDDRYKIESDGQKVIIELK